MYIYIVLYIRSCHLHVCNSKISLYVHYFLLADNWYSLFYRYFSPIETMITITVELLVSIFRGDCAFAVAAPQLWNELPLHEAGLRSHLNHFSTHIFIPWFLI